MLRNRVEPALEALLEPRRQRLRGASNRPNPPASCVTVSPRGSSNSASGLPRVSATMRSRTRSSSRNGAAERRSARASPLRSPCTSSSGSPRRSGAATRAASREPDRFREEPPSQQTRASLPTPRRAIARRRRRRAADAPRRLREQGQERQPDEEPIRRRSLRSSRTRSRGRCAVVEGGARPIRAAAHTAGARRRTPAPSRTRRPQREGAACPLPIPRRSPEALSSRPRVRHEGPACGSRRHGWQRSRHRAGRIPLRVRASSAREPGGDRPLCLDPNPTTDHARAEPAL